MTGASDDDRLGAGEYAAPGEPELLRLKRAYLEAADPHWGGICANALDEVLAAWAAAPAAEQSLYEAYIDDVRATMRSRLAAKGDTQD